VILGDSQETSPGGLGSVYVPRLDFEFFRIYGHAPETPLTSASGSTGGGSPWAAWMIRLSGASPGLAASRVPPSSLPPNIRAGASSALGGMNVNNNQLYGSLVMLQPDAADTNPQAGLAGSTHYMDVSQGVYLDVYAAANASSGEVHGRITPALTHAPSYFQPTTGVADTSLALNQPGALFRRQRLGPFGLAGRPYFQVELSGTNPAAFTDIIAVDFASAANPAGFVVTTLSAGGYKVSDYLAGHAAGTPLIALYNPDMIWISYGANDAGVGRSPQNFRDDLTALITHLRLQIRPDLPIVIVSDPYRVLPADQLANLDRYPGVAYDIAMHDPLVCALNSRRLTDAAGWTPANSTTYLADGVHYNAVGAMLKASLEVQALVEAFGGSPCDPDLSRDGNVDIGDVDYLINVVAGGDNPAAIDPDFSRDGNVDTHDIDALINVVAGGDCP
jgi:lysophospholipase L1-like esterase